MNTAKYLKQVPKMLKRTFRVVGESVDNKDVIRVMQWNILAQALCSVEGNFIKAPPESVTWDFRKHRILEEIYNHSPDVIALEEVDHYHDHFEPSLVEAGYRGFFNPKPDSPCSTMPGNTGPDGCSVFYKSDKFDLIESYEHSIKVDGAISNQCAQFVKIGLKSRSAKNVCVVVALHLKAKPGFETTREKQGSDILDVLKNRFSETPAIICGDFNAEPSEKVYELFTKSALNLKSAYRTAGGSEPEFTTWKIRPGAEVRHTIDYIWYSSDSFTLRGVSELPKTGEEIGPERLPSYAYPSDHLALCCDLSFAQ